MKRSEEREQAFILVFEKSFKEDSMREIIEQSRENYDKELSEFAVSVSKDIIVNLPILDELIEKNSRGWKKDRLPKVTLAILRLALYEMIYLEDIPISVSINEAVELAKKFATENDASFINGILGSIAKRIEGGD
ncbi:transcription antitermination factor NusB [Candidatus Soleaferrea massiliensis]|uniref:transcription antitermination factor NusB n=1 Tax=Candidatus Soleaferrea massiliensis TaxID=1470354 RepID=UPI00058D59A0|nr:transcription antitermination factor NusB [Candidatus Soleaferrea massiliensis]